jgi:hypothetical protein
LWCVPFRAIKQASYATTASSEVRNPAHPSREHI